MFQDYLASKILILTLLISLLLITGFIILRFVFGLFQDNRNKPQLTNTSGADEALKQIMIELRRISDRISAVSVPTEANQFVDSLKVLITNLDTSIDRAQKKDILKILNRVSQGLYRFLNGDKNEYLRKDVDMLFDEINDIFGAVNCSLIMPDELDYFNEFTMKVIATESTGDTDKVDRVCTTKILGYRDNVSNAVLKKAEIIKYVKES